MSKNQNHGKTKAWRKPEYNSNRELVLQDPHVRRKSKGTFQISSYPSPLLIGLLGKVGIKMTGAQV